MTGTTSSDPELATITVGADLDVSRIGYGAMQLTGDHVWGEYPDRDGAIALLRNVVESGITFIDTADVYGPHTNENLIHDALYPYPDGLVIATKGGFVRGGYDYSTLGAVGNPNYLRQSAHMSARRLGVEQIDLYYLHSGTATDVPFADQVATLAELREQGLIRNSASGVANVAGVIACARGTGPAACGRLGFSIRLNRFDFDMITEYKRQRLHLMAASAGRRDHA